MPLVRELVRLSEHQLSAGGGQQEIDYMLDRPPYTRYYWNGDEFVSLGADDAISGATVAVTEAEFDDLVADSDLVIGARYYIDELPALWEATGVAEVIGLGFTKDGITYFGDQAAAAATEQDMPAGTWATRPTSDPGSAGTVYYRRMTDIGTTPGGTVMCWLCGTSTEWRVMYPTVVIDNETLTSGAQNTSAQALNPLDIPAGLLNACGSFELFGVAQKTGTTDAMTSVKFYIGTAGTTADALTSGVNSSAIAAGDRTRAAITRLRVSSSTQLENLAVTSTNTGAYASTSGSDVMFTKYTASAADALKLSLHVQMGGATTDTPQCAYLRLTLLP